MKQTYVLFLGLLLAPNVHAYIDPGTGTLMVQMALAALAGCLFYIKGIYYRIKRLLGLAKPAPESEKKPTSESGSAEP